jgi:acyl carrier protein phosphodiesterase
MTKRSHKRMDPDVKALTAANRALLNTSRRMRRATLEFLWDKYVIRGWREPAAPHEKGRAA